MEQKTSKKLDVGAEDFEEILNFITEDEAPSLEKAEQKQWSHYKTLLLAPPQNQRALRSYFQQMALAPSTDKIKKAG